MAGTTPIWALPYPSATDLVRDGATAMQSLAAAIDSKLTPWTQGTLATRPVSTVGSPGKAGRFYRATDGTNVGITYRDFGTGWDEVGATLGVGGVTIGGDTNLFRPAALTLASSVLFRVPSAAAGSGAVGLRVGDLGRPLFIQNRIETATGDASIAFNAYADTIGSTPTWHQAVTDATNGAPTIIRFGRNGIRFYQDALATVADATYTPTLLLTLTNAGVLQFGSAVDTTLYRSAAATLKTDGAFAATSAAFSQNDASALTLPGAAAGLTIGGDASLLRGGTNTLITPSIFRVGSPTNIATPAAGDLLVGGGVSTLQWDESASSLYGNRADASANPNTLSFRKSRGAPGAPAAVVTGDDLLWVRAYGYGGASLTEAARIRFDTVGTIADGRVPGRILFDTATDAAPSVLTNRLTIDSAGLSAFTGPVTAVGTITAASAAATQVRFGDIGTGAAGVLFGSAADANLYRTGAGALKTDGSLEVVGTLTRAGVNVLGATPSSAVQVRDVGEVGQVRAGRVLAPADFTNMGLGIPLGLWNLGSTADASGNARALTVRNTGNMAFDSVGIDGAAAGAARFTGADAAAYIASAAWQQITTGSWGCWFRTAKRGTAQQLLSKYGAAGQRAYDVFITAGNVLQADVSFDGTAITSVVGSTDVADDRWHFAVVSFDGSRSRLYVDGVLEASLAATGTIFAATAPLNVGASAADATTVAVTPSFGRVDEAFLTADVLSEEQVRNLYCAAIPHALGATPSRAGLNVRRRRRGAPIATTDFPATPLRLHNFTAGSLADQGSNGVAIAAVGGGSIVAVAGADGASGGAYQFAGAHTGLGATDTGLPAGTTTRSFGMWFKSTSAAGSGLIGWGTLGTGETRLAINTPGNLLAINAADTITGPYVLDGQWHHVVVVENNGAPELVKRKLYLDGRLVGGSTVLTAVTLAGANKFRVGANPDGTQPLIGSADGAFVTSSSLTPEQVHALYNLGSQALAASPKAENDHIEALEATRILATFDTLEGCDQIDMKVAT